VRGRAEGCGGRDTGKRVSVTLGRLLLAWLVVAVWFVVGTFLSSYLVARLLAPPGGDPYIGVPTYLLKRRVVEATLLTLIASLWFDSLGSGQWWLLFLLIGALAATATWSGWGQTEAPKRAVIVGAVADITRYVIAGALLAWRLS
jgi:hypothetical protein